MVESTPSHRSSRGDVAVEITERLICGAGAVSSAAAAEGLALAGSRAARVLAREDSLPSSTAGASAPWVLHRNTVQRAAAAPFGAFELVAATGQEAVDHCLVAHLAGVAGECVVDPALAERLCLYQPLGAQQVEPLMAEADQREHAPPDQSAVLSELSAAFSRAGRATGRATDAVVPYGTTDADVVIVAAGEGRFAAQDIADALRRAKLSCGVLGITLIRPFPVKELAALLVGKRAVVVAEPAWTHGRFKAGVEAAIAASGSSKRPALHELDVLSANALQTAAKLLGAEVSAATEVTRPAVVLGALPSSPRALELLLAVTSRLATVATFEIWQPETGALASTVAIGSHRPRRAAPAAIDVLFVAHPVLIDPLKLADGLSDGATIAITSTAKKPELIWGELSSLQRELITRKKVRLVAFDPQSGAQREAESPAAPWEALIGALAGAAERTLVERLSFDAKAMESVRSAALVDIDVRSTPPAGPGQASLAAKAERPRLPRASGEPNAVWRNALRRFHVSAEGAAGASALLPLAPLAVTSLIRERGTAPGFPLLIDEQRDPMVIPLEAALTDALEAAKQSGASVSVVTEHLPRLLAMASQVATERPGAEPAASVLPKALDRFGAEFSLSAIARKSFDEELAAVRAALPRAGRVLGLGEHAHLEVYAAVVLSERRRRTAAFVKEVRLLAERLSEILRLEAARSSENAPVLGLGDADSMFDAAALVKAVPKQRGPRELGAERKARLERLVAVLKRYVAAAPTETEIVVIHPGTVPEGLELGRAQLVRHNDGFGVAAGMFDGMARHMAEVFAATRAGKNELEGRLEDATEELPQLVWEGFTRDEIMLLPPIVVVETADRIWQTSLDSLSRLLRSGRPVHALIEERAAVGGTPPGLGYVLVAHHEAFVAQSTLAQPAHLAEGFSRMAAALRPAVSVVLPRPTVGPMPSWLELAAAHEGRAVPCFRYDPDAGSSWADCFDIDANPAKEQLWPQHSVEILDADGATEQLTLGFTFADAAALGLAFREHFWVIPAEAWSDEQVELERYVASLAEDLPQQIPFIWVVTEDGTLARAVVSRKLAFECRERQRVWHIVQELGGADNEHARRAAAAARQGAAAEAALGREELEAAHAAELERVRNEEAAEALSRLARALLDPGALLAAPGAPPAAPRATEVAPAAPAAPEPAAPSAEAAAPAPAEEEEAVSFSDPFIDTPLCTTCNECTNLNPLMFKYNADKQAYLADAKAGTFLQLVTAAEKCPAACIHPGAPRADDSTATADVVARAARFN